MQKKRPAAPTTVHNWTSSSSEIFGRTALCGAIDFVAQLPHEVKFYFGA